MNKELKEQAHKEFDEKYCNFEFSCEDCTTISQTQREKLKSFIDSLIDRTVQMTEERIVGVIEQWKNGDCKQCGEKVPNWNCKGHAYCDLLSLITNKNDINK